MATVPAPPALDPGSADPAEVTGRGPQAAGGAVVCAAGAAPGDRVRRSHPAPPAAAPRGSCPVEQARPSCPPTAPSGAGCGTGCGARGFDAGAADGVTDEEGRE